MREVGRELIAGDVVVVSRTAVEDKVEITVRKVAFDAKGIRFDALPDEGEIEPLYASEEVSVLGLVLQAIMVF
ncbi:hypothetical protein JS562_26740 [Agrobacterium sp. S2]|nr:hypothetical protein [Agrobacterium sp. S2]